MLENIGKWYGAGQTLFTFVEERAVIGENWYTDIKKYSNAKEFHIFDVTLLSFGFLFFFPRSFISDLSIK